MTGFRVAVIGCGIGGLTAAIALKNVGIDAQVYEQADQLGEVGAGVGLWPNALRALEPLGLAATVLSLSGGPIGSALRRPDGRYLLRQPAEVVKARWGAGFISVHRAELHAALAAALDPATIHLGARCTGFEQTGESVRVQFDGGDQQEVDLLVGADGVHSVVRAQVAGPARLRYRGYANWRGVTTPGSVPHLSEATETWGRGAHMGIQPTSGDRILWYAGCNVDEGGKDDEHTHDRLLETFAEWHQPLAAVIAATPRGSLIRNDIYDCRPSWRWSRGSVTLVGDAIHPMTPDLGQGACQAIVDATTLATCLAETKDVPEALTAYRRARARNAAVATMFSRSWGGLGQLDGRLVCALRDTIVGALPLPVQLRQLDLVIQRPRRGQGPPRPVRHSL